MTEARERPKEIINKQSPTLRMEMYPNHTRNQTKKYFPVQDRFRRIPKGAHVCQKPSSKLDPAMSVSRLRRRRIVVAVNVVMGRNCENLQSLAFEIIGGHGSLGWTVSVWSVPSLWRGLQEKCNFMA
jgi:hypothetical protein